MVDIHRCKVYSDDGRKVIGEVEFRPNDGKWFAIVNGKASGSFKSRWEADERVTEAYQRFQPVRMEEDSW